MVRDAHYGQFETRPCEADQRAWYAQLGPLCIAHAQRLNRFDPLVLHLHELWWNTHLDVEVSSTMLVGITIGCIQVRNQHVEHVTL